MNQNGNACPWEKTARTALKSYYLGYGGVQWQEYVGSDMSLLTTKICFALFGPPTKINNDNMEISLRDVYPISQREVADKIKDKIMEIYNKIPGTKLRIGIIFISCQQSENEFLVPIFRIYIDKDSNNNEISYYIDTNCRVYKSWTDWKNNNTLPPLKYCYPSRGFYTCSQNNTYKFDPEKEPDVEFGTSPSGNVTAKVVRQFDILSSVTSLGSGAIAVIGMFTPLAPAIVIGSTIAGTTAAVYGTGRSIDRLIDKGGHGESLTDLESFTCWLTIILTPAHLGTSLANGALATGARNSGRIFSSTVRAAATILNLTTFSLDSILVVVGLTNLIEKANNNQLTTLDIVQFSLSVFFFGHTLIQPKTASGIIKAAQNEHITAYKNSITDSEAQKSFQDFLDQNRGNNNMKSNSKIVRTINRIDDPNKFFKSVKDMKVDIGGRKGRTVTLTDNHGQQQRVNPNRPFNDPSIQPIVTADASHNDLSTCYGRDTEMNQSNNVIDRQVNSLGEPHDTCVIAGNKRNEPIQYGVPIELNSFDIKFSQSTVNDPNSIAGLKLSMFYDGWIGDPIDVVQTLSGEYVTLDNRRLLAAKWNGIKVKAIVHRHTDLLPESQQKRFDLPRQDQIPPGRRKQYTYGDALAQRIGKQGEGFQPTINSPAVICRPGESESF